MALKGKKKSRSRGSQARRRPAAAPRPTYGGSGKARWYQTTIGLVVAFIAIVTVAIFVWWFVASNRNEARELEAAQQQIETYTGSLEASIQNLTPVVGEMAAAAAVKDEELAEKVKVWKNELSTAQTTVAQAAPPPGLEAMGGLLTQAVLLYVQSAEQYALLPKLEGDIRDQVAAKAAASFSAANGIFASSIAILDAERQENDLDSSGLQTPGVAAQPTPTSGPGELQVPVDNDAEKDNE